MKNLEEKFYKDYHDGLYDLPEGMYEYVITALRHRSEKSVRIRRAERHYKMEQLKEKYKLQGLKFTREEDTTTAFPDLLGMNHVMTIRPKMFLANLQLFYNGVGSATKVNEKTPYTPPASVAEEKIMDTGAESETRTLGDELRRIIREITEN